MSNIVHSLLLRASHISILYAQAASDIMGEPSVSHIVHSLLLHASHISVLYGQPESCIMTAVAISLTSSHLHGGAFAAKGAVYCHTFPPVHDCTLQCA